MRNEVPAKRGDVADGVELVMGEVAEVIFAELAVSFTALHSLLLRS
jgi:hypothetical protein